MENSSVDWLKVRELLEERLKNARISEQQNLLLVNMEPYEEENCFYSMQMLRKRKSVETSSFFTVPEALEQIIEEGKKQETSSNLNGIIEAVRDFIHKIENDFSGMMSKLKEMMVRELAILTMPADYIINPFRQFQEDVSGPDDEILKTFEQVIRNLNKFKSEEWNCSQVTEALDKGYDYFKGIQQTFQEKFEELLLRIQKCKEDKPYSMVQELNYIGGVLNNKEEKRICERGIDCNPTQDKYAALNELGELTCTNILNDSYVFKVKVSNGNFPYDICKWSPCGTKIFVALNKTAQLQFFDSKGHRLKELVNTNFHFLSSCIWLTHDLLCIAFHSGSIRVYSYETGSCLVEVENLFDSFTNAMDNEGRNIIYTMSSKNTLYKVNLKTKEVLWKKENWHSGCQDHCKFGLKLSYSKKYIVTGGCCDNLVKMLQTQTQEEMWSKDIGSLSYGSIQWAPGDTFIIAPGFEPPKIVVLLPENGSIIMEFSSNFNPESAIVGLALHVPSKHLVVGDFKGTIHKLKIVD